VTNKYIKKKYAKSDPKHPLQAYKDGEYTSENTP